MAIGTSAKALTTTWQNVGTGPLFMQRQGSGNIRFAIQATEPAADDPGFSMDASSPEFSVTVAENVWARAVNGTARVVVATLA